MQAKQYRSNNNMVEAIRYMADTAEDRNAIFSFCGPRAYSAGNERPPIIVTITGEKILNPGQYVVKESPGDFIILDKDDFLRCYDSVEGPSDRPSLLHFTDEQRAEFETLAKPVMAWLEDNAHPHVTVIMDMSHCQLTEGMFAFPRQVRD